VVFESTFFVSFTLTPRLL